MSQFFFFLNHSYLLIFFCSTSPPTTSCLFSVAITVSVCLCLIICFAFQIHIKVKPYNICLSLCDISHSVISSKSIVVIANGKTPFFFFNGWIIVHGIHIPHALYPYIYWWALTLLPYLGYSKQCCNEHKSAYIFLNQGFYFLWIYTQKWNSQIVWQFLEKAMAPHSSTLAWKIPWTEDPGGLQSMGSRRVRYN